MPARANDIVEHARTLVGAKWRHQGRGPDYDCAGVIVDTAVNVAGMDRQVIDATGYGRRPHDYTFLQHLKTHLVRISPTDVTDGCILAMHEAVRPCHIAITSTKNGVRHLIHGSARHRKVVEEPFLPMHAAKVVAAFRFPHVEYP